MDTNGTYGQYNPSSRIEVKYQQEGEQDPNRGQLQQVNQFRQIYDRLSETSRQMPIDCLRAQLNIKRDWGGALIGKGGETIKELRRNLKLSIIIRPPKQRRMWQNVDLEGTCEKLNNAFKEFHKLFKETNDEQYNETLEDCRATICIYTEMVGQIIGKQGAYIKQIKQESGATVRVVPSEENPYQQDVQIYGTGDEVALAFEKCCEQLGKYDFRRIKNRGILHTPQSSQNNYQNQAAINQPNQPVVINAQYGMPQVFVMQPDGALKEATIIYKDQMLGAQSAYQPHIPQPQQVMPQHSIQQIPAAQPPAQPHYVQPPPGQGTPQGAHYLQQPQQPQQNNQQLRQQVQQLMAMIGDGQQ